MERSRICVKNGGWVDTYILDKYVPISIIRKKGIKVHDNWFLYRLRNTFFNSNFIS